VRGAGRLKSCPNILVDAIIYGRDLKDDDDYVSEERFDKIRFYLEKGKYPPSADRSEKSRLRSAATHYRITNGKLMLKDKEVISDSQLQYEIARTVHAQSHGGINKTTANIAEKYHWVRIKETVSQVIRNCPDCKEHPKVPVVRPEGRTPPKRASPPKQVPPQQPQQQPQQHQPPQHPDMHHHHQQQQQMLMDQHQQLQAAQQQLQAPPSVSLVQQTAALLAGAPVPLDMRMDIPVDPQMMEGVEHDAAAAVAAQQQFLQQLAGVTYAAPVAPMHHMTEHDMAHSSRMQAVAAEAAARVAMSQHVEEDGTNKERHLLESLTAELKREGYCDQG
jgi:hypothetical protein